MAARSCGTTTMRSSLVQYTLWSFYYLSNFWMREGAGRKLLKSPASCRYDAYSIERFRATFQKARRIQKHSTAHQRWWTTDDDKHNNAPCKAAEGEARWHCKAQSGRSAVRSFRGWRREVLLRGAGLWWRFLFCGWIFKKLIDSTTIQSNQQDGTPVHCTSILEYSFQVPAFIDLNPATAASTLRISPPCKVLGKERKVINYRGSIQLHQRNECTAIKDSS